MTKYAVRIILWLHDKNQRGHFPIYIRITIDRKVRYISTGYFIPKGSWNGSAELVKDLHPLAGEINADVTAMVQKITRFIVDKNLRSEAISAAQVKQLFSPGTNLHNFFEFVEMYREAMEGKRSCGTLSIYKRHTEHLKSFHGSGDLNFEQIDTDYLIRYEKYLRGRVGQNYTHKLIICVRTMFNAAIRRGLIKETPFRNYELPKYYAPDKDYLTLRELDRLEELADRTRDNTIKQSVVYLLLGCYTGLRVSDWTKFDLSKNVKDGRVYLRATKNNEWVTMPVTGRLKRHLQRLREVKLTIEQPVVNRKLKDIARMLKISKHLTTHTGRHTFAITLCAEQGISSETCAELMGITIKTCVENYYAVTNRKVDGEVLRVWKRL